MLSNFISRNVKKTIKLHFTKRNFSHIVMVISAHSVFLSWEQILWKPRTTNLGNKHKIKTCSVLVQQATIFKKRSSFFFFFSLSFSKWSKSKDRVIITASEVNTVISQNVFQVFTGSLYFTILTVRVTLVV